MHVFVTGATGWVGSAVVAELIAHGHSVTGLARGEAGAAQVAAVGAAVLRGGLDDLDVLIAGAAASDAVMHLAFNHDFSKFADNIAQDQRAIETLGGALLGTDKSLIVTSGMALLSPGRLAVETDQPKPDFPRRSEQTAIDLASRGVRAACVRLAPSVHGLGDHGFVPFLIAKARETGVAAYIGDGANRWPGVHRLDAAKVYRLALEDSLSMSAYHAIADEGVVFRDIAAVIGKQLGLPVEPREPEHFGWFAAFAGADMPASSAMTQARLGWTPTQPGLLADLDQPGYFGG